MQWRLVLPGMALVISCGTQAAINHIHDDARQQAEHAADTRAERHLQLSRELPATPPDVLVALVEFIGEGGQSATSMACLMFSPTAAVQLSASEDVTSCSMAVKALHDVVSDRDSYINAIRVPTDAWSISGGTATMDGCAVEWDALPEGTPLRPPGPLPGRLTLTRQDMNGWLITNYRPC